MRWKINYSEKVWLTYTHILRFSLGKYKGKYFYLVLISNQLISVGLYTQ